jgi:hypothetical protein
MITIMYTIYKHTNLNNRKAYVGFTSSSMEERWIEHCYNALVYGSEYAFHRAIRKYGADCWTHEVLEVHPSKEKGASAEIRLIKEHKTYTCDYPDHGYNMTLGGESSKGLVWTLEQRIGHRGANSTHAKLTREEVLTMKRAFIGGMSQPELQIAFGVAQSNVSRIIRGITYPDIKLSPEEQDALQKMLHQRLHEKDRFVKDETRLKASINRSGAGNGMFGRNGANNPNFGSKRSEATRQLLREKALLREARKRLAT